VGEGGRSTPGLLLALPPDFEFFPILIFPLAGIVAHFEMLFLTGLTVLA